MNTVLHNITGCVLAGGQGSRMGGVDKGLQSFNGMALAEHGLQRLAPQVDRLLINANRNPQAYAALAEKYGARVVADAQSDYPGPLAGFLAGLSACQTPWLLTVPCDTPLFPRDLAQRLLAAAEQHQADIVVAHGLEHGLKLRSDNDAAKAKVTASATATTELRAQPVFCLLRAHLAPSLQAFMASGRRKIDAWTAQHRCASAYWDQPGDDILAFANANTLTELQALEQLAGPKDTSGGG